MTAPARAVLLLAALACAGLSPALAQDTYPSRPVRVIVPLSAGGSADVIPRIVADKLTTKLGQPFVVENRPGSAFATISAPTPSPMATRCSRPYRRCS